MTSEIKKNIKVILFVAILVKICGLAYKFLSVRLLTIDGMTSLSLLNPILSLCLCLSSLSIPTVINQRVAISLKHKNYSNRGLITDALKITTISSSIVSISLIFLAYPISHYLYKNNSLYICIFLTIPLLYLSNFASILKSYFDAHSLFKITAYSNLIEQLSKIIICISLILFLKLSSINIILYSLLIGLSISELLALLFLFIKVKKYTKIKIIKPTSKNKILSQATPLTLVNLISSLVLFCQPIIFTYALSKINYSTQASQRYYTLFTSYAMPLLLMAFFITTGITKAYFPMFCKESGNYNNTKKLLNKSLFVASIFSILNFNINYFHQEFLLSLFFNNTMAKDIVKNLSPFFFLFYFNPIFVCVMHANNLEKKLLINSIISSILSLFLIYILCQIPLLNTIGYEISIVVCNISLLLLNYIFIKHKLKFKINYKIFFMIITLLIFNILISILFINLFSLFYSLIVSNILTFIIYYYISKKLKFI